MGLKTLKIYIEEETFYRGHAAGVNPKKSNRKGITWVSQNKELAAEYGEEVSKVKFNLSQYKIGDLGEMNRSGTIIDLLKNIQPVTPEQKEEYDALVYNWGGGKQRLPLPKFLHKIGSKLTISYLKTMGITAILAKENGIITYGILSK